ncbi:receptor-like serine threonine-protein kinase [Musa troglodytarum]|nr:receptor-like serine threonine-protein kinase [Musa troglodytarum]
MFSGITLISGQPPIVAAPGRVHLIQWLSPRLDRWNSDEFIDERLQGNHDANSVRKVVDQALRCTTFSGSQRMTMAEVVNQLKESIVTGDHCPQKRKPAEYKPDQCIQN